MSDETQNEVVVTDVDAGAQVEGQPEPQPVDEVAAPPPPPPAVDPAAERLARLEGQLTQLQQQNQYLAALAYQQGRPAPEPEELPEVDEGVKAYIARERATYEQRMHDIQERLDAAEFKSTVMAANVPQETVAAAVQRYQAWQQRQMVIVDESRQPRRPNVMDALRFELGGQVLEGKLPGAGAKPGAGAGTKPAPRTEPVVTERPGRTPVAAKPVDPSKIASASERLEKYWYKELADKEF
jgi:hypothetical protein